MWDVKSASLLADITAPGGHKPSIHTIVCEPSSTFQSQSHNTGSGGGRGGGGIRDQSRRREEGKVSRFVTIGAGSHVMFYAFEREALSRVKRESVNRVPLSRKVYDPLFLSSYIFYS